jgi:hypothetical protein
VFDICWHSDIDPTQGEAVYYPWRWGNNFCPDYPEIKTIADSVAHRIINDQGTHYYATIYGRADDGGMARNWLYYALGAFAYTIEVSLGYQPPGYRVDSICRRVVLGAYYLLDRAGCHDTHGSSITGHVTDSLTGQPLVAEIKVLEATSSPDTILPRMSDSLYGRYWHFLQNGTYTLEVSKYGYYPKHISGVVVQPGIPFILDVALVRNPAIQDRPYTRVQGLSLYVNQKQFASRFVGIQYQLRTAGVVRLEVLDPTGRVVRELVNRVLPAGTYSGAWNGLTSRSIPAAPGVYFIRLADREQAITRKVSIR